jgi:hypothetical protein
VYRHLPLDRHHGLRAVHEDVEAPVLRLGGSDDICLRPGARGHLSAHALARQSHGRHTAP